MIEATSSWDWAVDLLQDNGFNVHLAHRAGNDLGKRRVNNDERDARDLADLLHLGRLAEAWIAPRALENPQSWWQGRRAREESAFHATISSGLVR